MRNACPRPSTSGLPVKSASAAGDCGPPARNTLNKEQKHEEDDNQGGGGCGGCARGAFGDGETPDKAVDGDVNTKWLDFRANSSAPAASRASVWLQFYFAAPTKLSGYRWYTANDFEERDPAAWRLLGSNDGVTWFVLNQVTYFKAASDRNKRAFSRRIDGGRR